MNHPGKSHRHPRLRWFFELKAILTQGWPPPSDEPQDIDWWRERIVTALLGLASMLGAAAYFPGMLLALSEGRYLIGIFDTVALGLLIFLFLNKKIAYRSKALAMITASMLLGVTLLISVGFYGAGYLWLFGSCLLTGVVWGFPYIAIIIGISIAILIAMGIAVDQKLVWWTGVENATEKWFVVTSNFFFLVAMLTTGISVLIRGFQTSMTKEIRARKALEAERTRLSAINDELIEQMEKRQQAENALGHSERKYHELLESIFDPIYTHDLNGRILSINTIAANALGYTPEDLVGKRVPKFLSKESGDFAVSQYLPRLQKAGHDMGTVEVIALDGQTHLFEYRSSLVLPQDGSPYVSGLARDVTLQRESQRQVANLREQLNQARKMEALGTLAGGIAHDFNNILSAIIGYTEMSIDNIADGSEEENAEFLARVIEAANRARELVRQILTFSRRSSGEKLPKRLQPIFEECLAMLRATIPANISINTRFNIPQAVIDCDATQIQQLLMNLCTNAAHSMELSGGNLTITVDQIELPDPSPMEKDGLARGEYVQILIHDQGAGIPEEISDRVFEPFFTTKPDKKGSGMGLAVVHGIVKDHQGKIDFTSSPQGTTFDVLLPMSHGEEAGQTQTPTELPRGDERIIFIDDEKALVDIGKKTLEKLGYQVTGFTNPAQALGRIRSKPGDVDLVITDQTMPGMTGLQIAGQVKKISPGTPVLLCTGFNNMVSQDKLAMNGVDQLLMKPVSRINIAQAIRMLLDKRPGA